jgi:hypothetical protein
MLYQKNNRRILIYIVIIVMLAIYTMPCMLLAEDDSTFPHERRIKAAFLYNFLRFIEWPKEKVGDANEPVIIGLIGKDIFGDAFDDLKDRTIEDRPVVLRRFKGIKELQQEEQEKKSENPQVEAVRKSHLLFICPSEKQHIKEILKLVKDYGVLTVADTEGFLESGGMINLLTENNKIHFEINITATKEAEFLVRSKLLRLAKRVYKSKEK